MPQPPPNLLLLHKGEESLRTQTLALVDTNENMADHLEITERAMDVMDVLRQHFTVTDDERAISHLAIRVFNDFATGWKLAASGYYQASILVMRDIIETTELVEYFLTDKNLVEKWRKSDRKALLKSFSPGVVRKALDKHEAESGSRRDEIYIKFSNLAAHPTVQGFAMLRPQGMDAHCGPFCDQRTLRSVLEEMGMLATKAGFTFSCFLDPRVKACRTTCHYFVIGAMAYGVKYFDAPFTVEDFAATERLLDEDQILA